MLPLLHDSRRILVAPLHWGLGHATRCIPIIDHYLSLGKEVAIAGDSSSFDLLKKRYPDLPAFDLPAYNISYGKNMVWSIMSQSLHLLSTYNKEKKRIKKLVKEWQADTIISDNRFGVYHPDVHNIYLTHQTNILHDIKLIALVANRIHHSFINQYDECWIPDYEDSRLSGRLSQGKVRIPYQYIGPLTRLEIPHQQEDIDVLVLLSGPEPARTHFAENLLKIMAHYQHYRIVWINGKEDSMMTNHKHILEYGLVGREKIAEMIARSRIIISRSGYSTIMDLDGMHKTVIFVPTPGQTEQEYLAQHHNSELRVCLSQDKIDVELSKHLTLN